MYSQATQLSNEDVSPPISMTSSAASCWGIAAVRQLLKAFWTSDKMSSIDTLKYHGMSVKVWKFQKQLPSIFFPGLFFVLRKETDHLSSSMILLYLTYSIRLYVCFSHLSTDAFFFFDIGFGCIPLTFFIAICLFTSLFLSQFHCQSLFVYFNSFYINSTICLSLVY